MRKHYLDNIRWITVIIVVLYHVIYMYNTEGIAGVVGRITNLDVQYYDAFQYMVYPWFMFLLFAVSGVSSRLYLDNHTEKEFRKSRTAKCLVPSTIGLFTFQFIQGYVNASISGAVYGEGTPFFVKYLIVTASGIGVLWYIQLLWLFSILLIPIRRIEKDKLWNVCKKVKLPVLIALVVPAFLCAQVLNTPLICVYRFGYYFFAFLLGYFVLSHDEVINVLKKWFYLFLPVAIALGIAFTIKYFGQVYADKPINRTVLFVTFGYFTSMAIFGGFARFFDFSTKFTSWMAKRSFGLYVFHYLGISAVALYIAKPGLLPAPLCYLLSAVAGFLLAYLLNFVISHIPVYRWTVLGIKGEK